MSRGFQFKQFYVAHDRCAMKVGTDGVLLGATAAASPLYSATYPENPDIPDNPVPLRVLDIGTGTGLVALMIAQRYFSSPYFIDAIDIVPEAVEQARENFANSPWSAHLHAYQSSLQDWQSQPYHLIVSNPPYFVDSLKNPDKNRETARHTDTLSYEDLIKHSKRLLAPDGVLQLILPIEAEQEIRRIATAYDLYPTYTLYIRTTPTKSPKRFIIRFSPCLSLPAAGPLPQLGKGCLAEAGKGLLTLMGPNGEPRSQEYQELMKDFYL